MKIAFVNIFYQAGGKRVCAMPKLVYGGGELLQYSHMGMGWVSEYHGSLQTLHYKKTILLGTPVVSSFVGGVFEIKDILNKKKILSGSARRYLLSLGIPIIA